ncbi:multidrug efflux pump [Panacagrimonas perspica]|uniref:Multidrug efflux pump n=1 Tax=Panacagrimonas perspica TaxID=381431 RepID=A0A4S3KB26_9GAMM|nr:efflux RND transporter permease subunit [Panacagrimonas perspica]TDU32472.1 multidrug efflux pump [Panacagrimonas perspica]THD05388.1 multidrug transporter AcrB [Panacagrimonas perspica]
MWLSDLSVKRPVLATVLNLLLVVFGIVSLLSISVREYPDIDPPIVSVSTSYAGASAAVIETQITQIIEDQIAGIEGIKRLTSSSRDARSNITVEFQLSRNIDDAANDVRDRVSRVLGDLPDQADPPEVTKADADASAIMFFVLSSPHLNRLQLTDYAERYLVDRFAVLDGVSRVSFGGDQRYAMRIWLDRARLAARSLTAADVESAIAGQNVERPAGLIESSEREYTLRTERQYTTPEAFGAMVVATGANGFPVRVRDVARVELGAENPRTAFRANGVETLGIGIIKTSSANTLEVARGARAMAEQIRADLPEGMTLDLNFDTSEFIEAALHEVEVTLAYAALFVIAVIYLFLGSARATLIPALTVPISLVASFIFLSAFGFSINILTLLALVLAIGLVVDDAIVMVENIHRRLELGEPPLLAAYRGAREVGMAIIATTAVLMAVFTPLALLEGNVGRLFSEFALALAASVGCSGVIALTLSPVLSVWLLRAHQDRGAFFTRFDAMFDRFTEAYLRLLHHFVAKPLLSAVALAGLLGAIVALFLLIPKEFAPQEDRGILQVNVTAPEGASFAYTAGVMEQVEKPLLDQLNQGEISRVLFRLPGFGGATQVNTGSVGVTLSGWKERERNSTEISNDITRSLADVTGARVVVTQRGAFGSRGGQPVQIVMGGPSYEELAGWRDRVLARVEKELPKLVKVDTDYKETKPQFQLDIDVGRAGDLGVRVGDIAQAIESIFGERRVTRYQDRGEEYEVMLQAPAEDRTDPAALGEVYVRAQSGSLVPLSNLVRLRDDAAAATYNRVDRLRSITISANLAPGYTLGIALAALERIVREESGGQARIAYAGDSREFKESSTALYFTFAMALVIVYLVLCAQFESFIHPVVILTTVPLALFGALIALWPLGMTLNVYSQIGIVMLVGLAAKNGILIVEFANQRRDQGLSFDDALIDAARIRLRPILMTSIATIAGAIPLIMTSGAGYEARRILGVVIAFGVAFSTVFTLFMVPAFYSALCRKTGSPGRHAAKLAQEDQLVAPTDEVAAK